jgi:hypothetical protein
MATDDNPAIVTICGSHRFQAEITKVELDLTLAGCVVYTPVFPPEGTPITGDQMDILETAQLAKIRQSQRVYVVVVDDRIPPTVRREIKFANSMGKIIEFWENESHGRQKPPE